MASSKKTGSSKSKSSKSEAAISNVKDAAIETPKVEGAVVQKDQPAVDPVQDGPQEPDASKALQESTPSQETVDVVERVSLESAATDTADQEQHTSENPHPSQQEPAQAAVVVPPVEKKGSTFVPLVMGGIIAGVIGFMASELDFFGRDDAGITTKLRSDLSVQQERIAALETAEPPALEIPEVDLSPVEARLEELANRLVILEERPAIVVPDGVDPEVAAAYALELEALKASAETQRSEIEALLNNAKSVEQATAEAAKAARAQAAITNIVSAIDAGQPFSEAITVLQSLDLGALDPALGAVAAEGVTTLSSLQSEFPDQARAALSAARAAGTGEGQQGLGGFLKRSLGARSVTPRAGDDPDAVLSRAEAAIKSGDLSATLTELDTLPEEAQAAIADWRAAANARVAARAAADALTQRLTAD